MIASVRQQKADNSSSRLKKFPIALDLNLVKIAIVVGPIAQSVEQRTFNPWVDGSSPSGPTFADSLAQ